MNYDPTPLEQACLKAMLETRARMDRERYSLPRPRPRWLGAGGAKEIEDLAQVRAVLKIGAAAGCMNARDEKTMRDLSKIALEQALQMMSRQALEFSKNMPRGMDAKMALESFASAILSTNAKVWPAAGAA